MMRVKFKESAELEEISKISKIKSGQQSSFSFVFVFVAALICMLAGQARIRAQAQLLHTYTMTGTLQQVKEPVKWVFLYHSDGRSLIDLADPFGKDQYILHFGGLDKIISTRSTSYFDRDDIGFADSAEVIDGHYRIKGLLSGPVRAVLVAKSEKGYVKGSHVFLEPGEIHIYHTDSFSNIRVTGSRAQLAYESLLKKAGRTPDSLKGEMFRKYAQANPASPIALWALQEFAGGEYILTTGIAPKAEPVFKKLPVDVQASPLGQLFVKRLEVSKMFEKLRPFSGPMDSMNTLYYKVRNAENPDVKKMSELETRMFNMGKQINNQVYLAYADKHPGSPAALYALTEAVKIYEYPDVGYVLIEPYFKKLAKTIRNSVDGKQLAEKIAISLQRGVGRVAPDFKQPDSTGQMVELSSFRGKYVLVDFWASWCGPCRAESPNLVEALKQYGNKGFSILSVSLDSPGARDKWLKAVRDDQMTWTNVSDLKGWNNAAARLYGIMAVPSNFLIGPKGIILAKNLRGAELKQQLSSIFEP